VIRDLLHSEMAEVHARWYTDHADSYRRRTREAVERGRRVGNERRQECRAAREIFVALLDRATTQAEVDCWICPATGSVAPIGYSHTGDSWLTSFWSLAGWPAISIPANEGRHSDGPDGSDRLPYGLQCIAPAEQDEQLLAWAGALQEVFAERHPSGV
jgi:Asp-tRNA(Asn)/Glu-tRNA(Gln) amidotransferase A subunit family amidase